MRNLVVVLLLAASSFAQTVTTVSTKETQVTGVAGESWLNHLHRALEETSMGKTGRLGPPTSSADDLSALQQGLPANFRQSVTLHGSDLYRMNCQGCHGEAGLGAPPEINSVINPTRATSASSIMDQMKQRGMEISRGDATTLANQSKASLLQRLHNGGVNMPPFPHLTEPEVRAIYGYLRQLAEMPGAEKQQMMLEESPVRVGEHIVKSTCHICHSAAGPNPTPEQLSNGAIPPLSTLTARVNLTEFVRKIKTGSPVVMGTPALPCRGRMPVFYYLSESEVADAYLYLSLYPPYKYAVLDPAKPAPLPNLATTKPAPLVSENEPAKPAPPSNTADVKIVAIPLAAEIFVALLMVAGLTYTLFEVKRIAARTKTSDVLVISERNAAAPLTRPTLTEDRVLHVQEPDDNERRDDVSVVVTDEQGTMVSFPIDHSKFESSWLARRLEKKNYVA